MPKYLTLTDYAQITGSAPIKRQTHGWRAKCLQRLVRLEMPVPQTIALSFAVVREIATGAQMNLRHLLGHFPKGQLLSVRPSAEHPQWGGPAAILNIGMNDEKHAEIAAAYGEPVATALYLRFVQSYAAHVAHLDPDMFDATEPCLPALQAALRDYEAETEEPFPQSPAQQLADVLRSMARAWEGTSARLLRQAKGAPLQAGLGLVVQAMAGGIGAGESGAGLIRFIDAETGMPQVTGRFKSRGVHGQEAMKNGADVLYLTRDKRGPSLEERCPEAFAELLRHGEYARRRLREEMEIEFTLDDGKLWVLDAVTVQRSSRASVRVAVDLANEGIIERDEALMRIQPKALSDLLHRQVDARARTEVFVRGIAASPGAAIGRVVFSSTAAQACASRDEPCILVRRETTPEDIRGMHSAQAVLTERGGMTSHAAVIGRGLGVPCVVGASGMQIDERRKTVQAAGHTLAEGDMLTVDGTNGVVLIGEVPLLEPALDDRFTTLLDWADARCDIGIRANADTPADARIARGFKAQGIGLCRTEHMFFEDDRLTLMREMIFADTSEDRQDSLERLLPMQRADFIDLFEIMQGQPVCIRLFDPPLHEFLPHSREGMRFLADALDKPLSEITRRAEALSEFNPMLGMRGVRLGVTIPEIYEMQARAIFEATVEVSRRATPIAPEIMIPLVSAMREVELIKSRIDAIAATVRSRMGVDFEYRIGVMVETPRAALRAGDIALHASFLSFGTNDLTQMTYGLSRDDAGRFMSDYVQQGVFPEDPFRTLDLDGVGELLTLGAARGRKAREELTLSICGEHGGNPESIRFCRELGFDYVSCSPFRVPVARLAAAQLVIEELG
ncbi:putative PEP-binding protein [Roseinatronobacter bogoriensis]|uniref:Pyruvate, phosphate dikinase n=1 Tax=Roseinatronobacter bogoriensis subsp. barguzinensis TaxID=441209 RepID=A0A2K8KJ34_9RHOB|nr:MULTISPECIES: putative PEP-binding protein [Rhodobaca]ATX67765.1 pyruvate, phosphate dikinase [Rhodobaca barguzinensis]MBB4208185.1 pyruvate,orthophosphate dikinase [Rhodobaca bogoriensis DSM 18756]TDW38826.1 pyruvate,orthophosphate dikinase [Rhodobaca barguzinensis]TDY69136.1 pyruvate phosphate dikinase [Rhodobaca bogoriensis DSM 18756]